MGAKKEVRSATEPASKTLFSETLGSGDLSSRIGLFLGGKKNGRRIALLGKRQGRHEGNRGGGGCVGRSCLFSRRSSGVLSPKGRNKAAIAERPEKK